MQEVLASVHALLGIVCQGTEDHATLASCRHANTRMACGPLTPAHLSPLPPQAWCMVTANEGTQWHDARVPRVAAISPCRATVDPSVQPLAGLQPAGGTGHSMHPLLGVLGTLLDTLEHFLTQPFPTPVAVPAAGFLGLANRILDLTDASPGTDPRACRIASHLADASDYGITAGSIWRLQGMHACPLRPNVQRQRCSDPLSSIVCDFRAAASVEQAASGAVHRAAGSARCSAAAPWLLAPGRRRRRRAAARPRSPAVCGPAAAAGGRLA